MSENVVIEQLENVLLIRLNRPEKKNAITQQMYAALAKAIIDYGNNSELSALVITGIDNVFTAGNDLADFKISPDGDTDANRFLNAIRDCPKMLIASVNGIAVGVGLTLLLHCDLVYCSENATFSAPFVSLGLVPEAGSSVLLPQVLGKAVANDIFYTGRKITADEALSLGFVSRVFNQEDLLEKTLKIAKQLANSGVDSVTKTKALINCQTAFIKERMKAEEEMFLSQLESEEFKQKAAAFSSKSR